MAGQLWGTPALGGNFAQAYLTKWFRYVAQPLMRFRQVCDVKEAIGKGRGDTFNWNVVSNVQDAGGPLVETSPMPATQFTNTKGTCIVSEFGNSVPLTRKLNDLSQHEVKDIIRKSLANDMAGTIDKEVFRKAATTNLIFFPTGGTSTTSISVSTNGSAGAASAAGAGLTYNHIIEIVDAMKERNIPTWDGENYLCISSPSTFTKMRKDLVAVNQYTESGYAKILNGEIGKFGGMRFIEQTNVGKVAATNPGAGVGWAMFVGGEAMIEALSVPEEIIEKEVTDYGRSMGIAWYMVAGYTPAFPVDDVANSRIAFWWPNASSPDTDLGYV